MCLQQGVSIEPILVYTKHVHRRKCDKLTLKIGEPKLESAQSDLIELKFSKGSNFIINDIESIKYWFIVSL